LNVSAIIFFDNTAYSSFIKIYYNLTYTKPAVKPKVQYE